MGKEQYPIQGPAPLDRGEWDQVRSFVDTIRQGLEPKIKEQVEQVREAAGETEVKQKLVDLFSQSFLPISFVLAETQKTKGALERFSSQEKPPNYEELETILAQYPHVGPALGRVFQPEVTPTPDVINNLLAEAYSLPGIDVQRRLRSLATRMNTETCWQIILSDPNTPDTFRENADSALLLTSLVSQLEHLEVKVIKKWPARQQRAARAELLTPFLEELSPELTKQVIMGEWKLDEETLKGFMEVCWENQLFPNPVKEGRKISRRTVIRGIIGALIAGYVFGVHRMNIWNIIESTLPPPLPTPTPPLVEGSSSPGPGEMPLPYGTGTALGPGGEEEPLTLEEIESLKERSLETGYFDTATSTWIFPLEPKKVGQTRELPSLKSSALPSGIQDFLSELKQEELSPLEKAQKLEKFLKEYFQSREGIENAVDSNTLFLSLLKEVLGEENVSFKGEIGYFPDEEGNIAKKPSFRILVFLKGKWHSFNVVPEEEKGQEVISLVPCPPGMEDFCLSLGSSFPLATPIATLISTKTQVPTETPIPKTTPTLTNTPLPTDTVAPEKIKKPIPTKTATNVPPPLPTEQLELLNEPGWTPKRKIPWDLVGIGAFALATTTEALILLSLEERRKKLIDFIAQRLSPELPSEVKQDMENIVAKDLEPLSLRTSRRFFLTLPVRPRVAIKAISINKKLTVLEKAARDTKSIDNLSTLGQVLGLSAQGLDKMVLEINQERLAGISR